jgi:hypothetical protein
LVFKITGHIRFIKKDSGVAKTQQWDGTKKGRGKVPSPKRRRCVATTYLSTPRTKLCALCHVVKVDKDHKVFGGLQGITARPFVPEEGDTPQCYLTPHSQDDFEMMEVGYAHVRPSRLVVVSGNRTRAEGLRTSMDVPAHGGQLAAAVDDKIKLYHDGGAHDPKKSLEAVPCLLPMLVNKKS